jgi:hypothetical protein
MKSKMILCFTIVCIFLVVTAYACLSDQQRCDITLRIIWEGDPVVHEKKQHFQEVTDCLMKSIHSLGLTDFPIGIRAGQHDGYINLSMGYVCEKVRPLIDTIPNSCSDKLRFSISLVDAGLAAQSTPSLSEMTDDTRIDDKDQARLADKLDAAKAPYRRSDCITKVVINLEDVEDKQQREAAIRNVIIDSSMRAASEGYLAAPPSISFSRHGSNLYLYLQYRYDCEVKKQLTEDLFIDFFLPGMPDFPKYQILDENVTPGLSTIETRGPWWRD